MNSKMLIVRHGCCLVELAKMEAESVHCCVTSPPYWGLRAYGIPPSDWPEIVFVPVAGLPPVTIPAMQCVLGEESEPWAFIGHLVHVFRLVKRVLRSDGTLWLNLGDCYATGVGKVGECPGGGEQGERWKGKGPRKQFDGKHGYLNTNRGNGRPKINGRGEEQTVGASAIGQIQQPNRMFQIGLKPKDLVGIPERAAFALQADGWFWRSKAPGIKRNPMPESTQDRPTSAVEHMMLFARSERYFYDGEAVKVASSARSNPRASQEKIAEVSAARAAGANTSVSGKGSEPKGVPEGNGIKNNESFQNALAVPVAARARRNSDAFFESWQGLLQGEECSVLSGKCSVEDGERAGARHAGSVVPLAFLINTAPYKGAHFATFPPKLVAPCILAGTSARGCCPLCGAQWVRVVEKVDTGRKQKAADGWDTGDGGHGTVHRAGRETGEKGVPVMAAVTTGWAAGCECGADPVPCMALDPFGGSGTVAQVANGLGRAATLIEIGEHYLPLLRERAELPLFAQGNGHERAQETQNGNDQPKHFEAQSTRREPEAQSQCEKCQGYHVFRGDCTICGHHQSAVAEEKRQDAASTRKEDDAARGESESDLRPLSSDALPTL